MINASAVAALGLDRSMVLQLPPSILAQLQLSVARGLSAGCNIACFPVQLFAVVRLIGWFQTILADFAFNLEISRENGF